MKGCKNNVAEGDRSDWMAVTRGQRVGEEVVEELTEDDGMRHDQFHFGGENNQIDRWMNGVAV